MPARLHGAVDWSHLRLAVRAELGWHSEEPVYIHRIFFIQYFSCNYCA